MRYGRLGRAAVLGIAFALTGWTQFVPDRYIVALDEPPVAAVLAARGEKAQALRTAAAGDQRQRVRTAQAALRGLLAAAGATVLASVETVANALIVETASAPALLEALPGVRAVYPVREFFPTLDAALDLHRVPEAWARVGETEAGRGVKIAIIDSGIDITHPGLQDTELTPPEGYPIVTGDPDREHVNGKVIVARSYAPLFRNPEPDPSARDASGHGTAVAMAAAGVSNRGPLATITGVAPRAFLGNYRIFGSTGINDGTTSDLILKALDDAVADGMDVVNMSFGSSLAPRLDRDVEGQAIETASALGVVVVVSAGNTGPGRNSVASPATTPAALSVGSSANQRRFATAAIAGEDVYVATPGDGPAPDEPVTGPLRDAGLGCTALPPGTLAGAVALIERGICTFEDKLNNAAAAGAVAGLVFTDERAVVIMAAGSATLPAQMIGRDDGLALQTRLADEGEFDVTLRFTQGPVPALPYPVPSFSAIGPNVDGGVKPDVLAAGTNLYTATQRGTPSGSVFSASGYRSVQGTSFSAPLVAGAVAVLRAARPGLTSAQYRSLLVNSATPYPAMVIESGAGLLQVDAALRATLAAEPLSLNLSEAPGPLRLTHLGEDASEYRITVWALGEGPPLVPSRDRISLNPGETAELELFFDSDLPPGSYQGYVIFADDAAGTEARVPYWYAVPTGVPGAVSVAFRPESARPGATVQAFLKVVDSNGTPMADTPLTVSAASGGGSVSEILPIDRFFPGVYRVTLTLGPEAGVQTFHAWAGDAGLAFSINATP
ncbi:MAG: S8 family serine peptidase [Bryobacterales bacterium]|nr:S8 family serine peptidase [Bryobacterales bacterium]